MLFWLCLTAPFLFWLISLFLGLITANYSQQRDTISYLVHGNYGHLQTLNFILCGLLIIVLAYLTRDLAPNNIRNPHLIKIGTWIFGASLLLLGLLPTDRVGEQTLIGQLHGIIFVVTVVIQAGLQIAFALSNLPGIVSISILITGIITALGLPSMMLFNSWRGIIQRIFVGAIVWWVTVGVLILRG